VLRARAIPDDRAVARNISVRILERGEGEVTHFVTLTFWQNLESIRAFAGRTSKWRSTPEDCELLLEFEPTVVHDEVVGES
jgi:hypothetical protein